MDGIYLMSSDGLLWFYDPLTHMFTQLGRPACPAPAGANPTSMAVDRRGNAWINYGNPLGLNQGMVLRARLNDVTDCTDPGLTISVPTGFQIFGMAYATDGENDNCDTLYLYDNDGDGNGRGTLARVDRTSLVASSIADASDPMGELSGTGDGRLYGFVQTGNSVFGMPSQTRLVQFDKTTAGELDARVLTGLELGIAFAFAFWGGDFYFFTSTGGNSVVTQLDFDQSTGGGQAVVVPSAPLQVVGAGVSTCASIVPPG